MTFTRLCPVCGGSEFRTVWRALPELRFGLKERFSIQRCISCGTMATDPFPSASYLAELYQRCYVPDSYVAPDSRAIGAEVEALRNGRTGIVDGWTRDRSTEVAAIFLHPDTSRLFAQCKTVLDVGCYTGENMLWLAAGGWTVTGVEPNPTAASIGRQLGLDIRLAYLEDCGLPDGSFDTATLSYVIEHLADPRKTLAELHRVLRPGGRMVVTTHNVRSLWRYCFGPYWINWHTPFHLHHFHCESLRRLVESAGFSTLHLTTRTPAYWLLFSIRAARNALLFRAPERRLYEPMTPSVASWLRRLLQLQERLSEGDCIIGVFERPE